MRILEVQLTGRKKVKLNYNTHDAWNLDTTSTRRGLVELIFDIAHATA